MERDVVILLKMITFCLLIGSLYFRVGFFTTGAAISFSGESESTMWLLRIICNTLLVILGKNSFLACSPRPLVVETFRFISSDTLSPVAIMINGRVGDHILGTHVSPPTIHYMAVSSLSMCVLTSSTCLYDFLHFSKCCHIMVDMHLLAPMFSVFQDKSLVFLLNLLIVISII